MKHLLTFLLAFFCTISAIFAQDDPPQEISGIDASIEQFISPNELESTGFAAFAITVKNNGPQIMQTLTINWSINDVEQEGYNLLNFYLPPGESFDVTIGPYHFSEGGEYDLDVWLSNPNGLEDMEPENNAYSTMIYVPAPENVFFNALGEPVPLNVNAIISQQSKKDLKDTFEEVGGKTLDNHADLSELKVEVYPNPTVDFLHVSLANGSSASLTIANASGQIISQFEITETNTIINSQNWAPGFYFLKVDSGEKSTIEKVVKSH